MIPAPRFFADCARFLCANPRYAPAPAAAADPQACPRAPQAAGYATDPHCAEKIIRVTGSEPLCGALQATDGIKNR